MRAVFRFAAWVLAVAAFVAGGVVAFAAGLEPDFVRSLGLMWFVATPLLIAGIVVAMMAADV